MSSWEALEALALEWQRTGGYLVQRCAAELLEALEPDTGAAACAAGDRTPWGACVRLGTVSQMATPAGLVILSGICRHCGRPIACTDREPWAAHARRPERLDLTPPATAGQLDLFELET